MSINLPGLKPDNGRPRPLEQDIDAATMAFLHVRLRIRDGEYGGALVAIVETMRCLSRCYVTCRKRHNEEQGR